MTAVSTTSPVQTDPIDAALTPRDGFLGLPKELIRIVKEYARMGEKEIAALFISAVKTAKGDVKSIPQEIRDQLALEGPYAPLIDIHRYNVTLVMKNWKGRPNFSEIFPQSVVDIAATFFPKNVALTVPIAYYGCTPGNNIQWANFVLDVRKKFDDRGLTEVAVTQKEAVQQDDEPWITFIPARIPLD
ncbi:MAG TPA: hypothetical protein VN457_03975 [Chlamydiales bacterium]|nr:hypothetical protein [Chlamydiales bacterium]